MYGVPSLPHGFFRMSLVAGAYAVLSLSVGYAAHWFGASPQGAFVVFLVAALVLLKPLTPLFRRSLPESVRPGDD